MWAITLCLLLSSGCSSLTDKREKQDILEAELRSQERHIMELKAEVERKEGHIHGLDLELEKAQQAASGQKTGEPQATGVIKEITLGRLTGGYRNNPRNGYDDSLQFLIEPRDPDGHAIKVPGSLHIELFEITPAGTKNLLSTWDVTHRELRRSWDQPLFGGPAYRILIPFKALPAHERMRVVIRMTTLDGKLFEAERDFTIRLPGPGAAPMLPMNAVPGGYSIVTPGHVINGNLVGPLPTPAPPMLNAAPSQTVTLPPPPTGLEGTGRTAEPEKKSEPKAPEKKELPLLPAPMLEPVKPNEKKDSIPVIPMKPRETPSTISAPGNEPPPLPPPPAVPEFDKNSMSYEKLPAPSSQPRSNQPLYPRDADIVQASYEATSSSPLTDVPPASWRTRHGLSVVVEQNPTSPIKLSRPVVVKQ